jgi:hypothetical protein
MNDNLQSQIIELEEQLRQAMLHSNVAELDTLIAPEASIYKSSRPNF